MKLLLIISLILIQANITAEVCSSFSEGETIATFPRIINESSGLAYSKIFEERFYHVNDSGSDSVFYYTDGFDFAATLQEIYVDGVDFDDAEDLALGRCDGLGEESCLFIADIGDNSAERDNIQIYIVPEQLTYNKDSTVADDNNSNGFFKKIFRKWGKRRKSKASNQNRVSPLKVLNLYYPDGKGRNSESFAVHPNGDLVLFTKESIEERDGPLEIYTVTYDAWIDAEDSEKIYFTKVGEIDFRIILPNSSGDDKLLTGMDISSDGDKFLLLSYGRVFEFNFDLSFDILPHSTELVLGDDFQIYELPVLNQQEAITYGPDDHTIYYSTEKTSREKAIVHKSVCLD